MKIRGIYFVVFVCLSTSACFSGSYKHKLQFSPSEPLRVAVLPFVQVDEHGNIIQADSGLTVDQVPIISSEVGETPADYVRKLVQSELNLSALDILAPYLVDTELPHHGFGLPDGNYNYHKIYSTPASQLCVHFLDCDAVLFGKITNWDRSYYGVQSVNTVGLELSLVAAKGDRILFSSIAEDHDSRGVSKGPTGYTSAVLEPIKGLDSQIILDLSEKVVRKMVSPLIIKNVSKEPKTPPPSIYATSHNARDGKVLRSAPLILVMYGSAKGNASFSIGDFVRSIPMEEHSPGNYYGEYHPLPSDYFSQQKVTLMLEDSFGRITSRVVSKEPLTLLLGN
jgi:hypothetical protein